MRSSSDSSATIRFFRGSALRISSILEISVFWLPEPLLNARIPESPDHSFSFVKSAWFHINMATPTNYPLTTTFTPPPQCLTQLNYFDNTKDNFFHVDVGPGTQCIPKGPDVSTHGYFSPGLYCPSGWTKASGCSSTVNIGSLTETREICCPKLDGISQYSGLSMGCNTNPLTLSWWSTMGCVLTLGAYANGGSMTATASNGSLITLPVQSGDGLNAYSVQLAYQASDLTPVTTTSQATTSTQSPGSTVQTSSSSSSTSQTSTSGGLSTTAKIAIGVVIPVIVLALIIGLGWFIMKRRRSRRGAPGTVDHNVPAYTDKPEQQKYGMHGFPPAELPHGGDHNKLHNGQPTVYEMPDSRHVGTR